MIQPSAGVLSIENLADKYYPYSMGETAENVARQWKISRHAQDEFALASQEKYFAAQKAEKWADEIVAVEMMKDEDYLVFER